MDDLVSNGFFWYHGECMNEAGNYDAIEAGYLKIQ